MTYATRQIGVQPDEHRPGRLEQADYRGRQAGAAWAAEFAEYLELKRLAAIAVHGVVGDEQTGYRVVGAIRGERQLSRGELAAFRETFGLDDDDADAQNRDYWKGFIESALDAFEKVEI